MKISSNDIAIIGLCLALAGSFLLAKSIITKDIATIQKEIGTYWNHNIFLLKGAIFQRYESFIGGLFLVVGFLLQLSSYFLPKSENNYMNLFSPGIINYVFLILFSIVLIWLGNIIARKISLEKYVPIIKTTEHLEALNRNLYVLEHNGEEPKTTEQKKPIEQNVMSTRIEDAMRFNSNIGLWLDIKKSSKETEIDFTKRLIAEYSRE